MSVKNVLRVAFPYLLTWFIFMLAPTLVGQPEVICATPFGLILALAAGTGVVVGYRAGVAMMHLTLAEAISSGALVGAFQGLLFAIWLPVVMAMRESRGLSEQAQSEDTALLVVFFLPVGTLAGALIGAILGAAGHGIRAIGNRRRRRSQ